MKHITDVLVFKNRCEVLESHTYNEGDKGFPHIRLKFKYMFESESLKGKKLYCKYILPNGKFTERHHTIENAADTIFPIDYCVFELGGWTTLRITLHDGDNKITLDDIILKTKGDKILELYASKEVQDMIDADKTGITELSNTERKKITSHAESEKKKAVAEIDKNKGLAVSAVTDTKTKAIAEVEKTKNASITAVTQSKTKSIEEITGSKNTSITAIDTAKKKSIEEIYANKDKFRGPQGPKGDPGPQGKQGVQGKTGEVDYSKLEEVKKMALDLTGRYDGSFPLSKTVQNGVYYCPANRKFYVSDKAYSGGQISVPNENFSEFGIYQNKSRLDNLFRFKKVYGTITGDTTVSIPQIKTCDFLLLDCGNHGTRLLKNLGFNQRIIVTDSLGYKVFEVSFKYGTIGIPDPKSSLYVGGQSLGFKAIHEVYVS